MKLKKQLIQALIATLYRWSRLHMGSGHKRADLRANAQSKLDDAIILLDNGRFSTAYYLAGYAIEIGLKACIAAQIRPETIPDKAFMKKFLHHEFRALVGLAGLETELIKQEDKDPDFGARWASVNEWSPDARYEAKDRTEAERIITAINDPISGVLQWIKTYW